MIDLEKAKQILANPTAYTSAEVVKALEIITKNAMKGL